MSSLASKVTGEEYDIMKKLGEGTFASVYSARNIKTGEIVAIKQVYVQRALIEQAMEEVNLLKGLENDHIISYKDSFYDSQDFYLNMVMELCHDSLRGQMKYRKMFSIKELESFLVQITSAFLALSNQNVMHLDLKPENILIANEEGTYFKLCDFGCAQISNYSKMSGYEANAFGTFNYLAPEMHFNFGGEKTRSSADMWSLGVTLYEMVFWKLPFSKESNGIISRKQIEAFFKTKDEKMINYNVASDSLNDIIDIIKMMLKPMPIDRLNWKNLKELLIKRMKVDPHEFLDFKDLSINFIHIFELLLKAARIMKEGLEMGNSAFWKANKQAGMSIFEEFVHFIYLVALKFSERQQYRWKKMAEGHQKKADNLIKEVKIMESMICKRKEIKQFETSDYDYVECLALDQMKAFRSKLQGEKNDLQFISVLFDALISVVSKSQGIFSSLRPFDACFKLKS